MAKRKATKKPIVIKGGTRPPHLVMTPEGEVLASSLPTQGPKRPIHFGRPQNNAAPEPAPKRVAGSRAAQAFIDSLSNQ